MRARTVPVTGATRSLRLLTDSMSPQACPGGDRIAGLGRGHVDHVAEGLLGEVGHSDADQPAGTGPDPQVIGAVSQVGRDVGHGSSDRNVLSWVVACLGDRCT